MTRTNMEELSDEIKVEANHACHIVQLIPYKHQVGGHNCMLSYDDKTICKPLDEQEHKVYNHFPDQLKEFIPQLYGVVKVHFERCGDDVLCFALPPDCSYCKDTRRLKNYLIATNAITFDKKESTCSSCTPKETVDGLQETFDSGLGMKLDDVTWNSQMKERLLSRWKRNVKSKEMEKFMLLENISRTFSYPCSVDLKMGTRGFGDNATKEKQERKQKRVDQSTSGCMGVRLCGMQIYHPVTSEYIFIDKYKGRQFTENDFRNCMRDFIYNGSLHRIELIQPVIGKLKTLLYHLENIECYRFYCSSLLLMYDGDVAENCGNSPDIEVRMIDFAHTRVKEEESNHHLGPDKGYIFGVRSLIDVFTQLLDDLKTS